MDDKPRADERIRKVLESAYADFHSHFHRERDPVSLVHAFGDPRDREVVALLAALLAYGNVMTILQSVRAALAPLGPSPYARLLAGEVPSMAGFRHRFTTGDDLEILFTWIAGALAGHGSLERFFSAGGHGPGAPMRGMLSDFVRRFTAQRLPPRLAALLPRRDRNLKYLLSDPERGSACKRLNMWLRWMVRPDDGIDLGLWTSVAPSQLVLPIDTHLLQTLRALRWTRSKQATWRVVEAATARLRAYAPDDPVRYDFALCHLSMSGGSVLKYKEAHARLE